MIPAQHGALAYMITDMEPEILTVHLLHMMKQPIRDFEKGQLSLSERSGMGVPGILYWLDAEQERMVREWEKNNGHMVYHVVHDYTKIGEMYTLLFVSSDDEDWKDERRDLKNGYSFCYVVNTDYPDCSEYGTCGIRPATGGVMRWA